jgi:MGT family glycosyltransferase
VVTNASHATQLADAGATFCSYDASLHRDPTARHDETPQEETMRVLRDVFLNPGYGDALLAEVVRHRPDVLLVDQMLLFAAAAAESTGLPTAILWHTVYGGNAGRGIPSALLDPLNAFRERLGLDRIADHFAATTKADAIIAFTYEAFDAPPPVRPAQLHYVGPLACLTPATPREESADARPLVLVSYSTSYQNQASALQRVADAVADLPVRVLMTLGHAITRDELRLPANVVAEPFVPHASVLPQARLVVTHAGHGTVMAAVTAGVPMVCTPMGRDQHAVAACVAGRGLGTIVPATASTEELRSAIAAALADGALQERARTFATQLAPSEGLQRAIDVLERLGSGA